MKTTHKKRLALSVSLAIAAGSIATLSTPVSAQFNEGPGNPPPRPEHPPIVYPARPHGDGEGGGYHPSPVVMPQSIVVPTPNNPTPPTISVTGGGVHLNTPTNVQTDFQSTWSNFPGFNGGVGPAQDIHMMALDGIILLPNKEFPKDSALQGDSSGITVKWKEGTDYKKVNQFVVKLNEGEILIGVKSPSKSALLETPLGKFSISSNSDVLARFDHGILRVANLDGLGKKIKAQFNKGFANQNHEITVALAPGYELVAGHNKLTRSDMRPRDGLARRFFKAIENGHVAVSEISLASILKANDLIADLRQANSGHRERRMLGDLSKMAAVLNYRNGTQGFTTSEDGQVASQEQTTTQ